MVFLTGGGNGAILCSAAGVECGVGYAVGHHNCQKKMAYNHGTGQQSKILGTASVMPDIVGLPQKGRNLMSIMLTRPDLSQGMNSHDGQCSN